MVGRNDPHAWGPKCPWGGNAHQAVRLAFLEGTDPERPSGAVANEHQIGKLQVRRVTSLAWACSFLSFVLLAVIISWLLAKHVMVMNDVSAARIPLASAPGGLLIVALAFGIATWVGDILPSWIQSDREPHDISLPVRFPTASWCTDCNRHFVDIGPAMAASSGHSGSVTTGIEQVSRPALTDDKPHGFAPEHRAETARHATTNLN